MPGKFYPTSTVAAAAQICAPNPVLMSSGDAAAATPAISVYDDDITPAERARRQKIAENQALMRRSLSSEMETLQAAVQKKVR